MPSRKLSEGFNKAVNNIMREYFQGDESRRVNVENILELALSNYGKKKFCVTCEEVYRIWERDCCEVSYDLAA